MKSIINKILRWFNRSDYAEKLEVPYNMKKGSKLFFDLSKLQEYADYSIIDPPPVDSVYTVQDLVHFDSYDLTVFRATLHNDRDDNGVYVVNVVCDDLNEIVDVLLYAVITQHEPKTNEEWEDYLGYVDEEGQFVSGYINLESINLKLFFDNLDVDYVSCFDIPVLSEEHREDGSVIERQGMAYSRNINPNINEEGEDEYSEFLLIQADEVYVTMMAGVSLPAECVASGQKTS